jgi:MFS family permease
MLLAIKAAAPRFKAVGSWLRALRGHVYDVWRGLQLFDIFSPLEQSFHASQGAISLIFSIAVPQYFLLGALTGPLADRFGAQVIALFGVTVGGLGLIYAGQAHALWQVYLGFGVGIGVGVGFSYVPSRRYSSGLRFAAALLLA